MPDCEEQIYSNDYVDFIVSKDVLDVIDLPSDCIQQVNEENDTYFYPRSFFRAFDFPADSYSSVPKCYGLLDETALEVSGILKLQQQPALALKGQGVMIGFIDTGIDYRNPVFQYSDGTTRIYRIWDQTIRGGTKARGNRIWFRVYDRADQCRTPGRKSTGNRSVHGYQWTWNVCGRGGMWKRGCGKQFYRGGTVFRDRGRKTERGKTLSAGILLYPGFCPGVSGK